MTLFYASEVASCSASDLLLGALDTCYFREVGWISTAWLCRAMDMRSFVQGV